MTGESIFGARVNDVTSMAFPIPGSFSNGGIYFILGLPEMTLRSVEVTAPGYTSKTDTITIIDGANVTLDFSLVFATSLNTAEITLPIGAAALPPFLLPPIVEAVQGGVVIGRTFVRNGKQYRISGIPNGTTTFRSASVFYDVGTTTLALVGGTTPVTIPVTFPGARGGPLPGGVGGVVTDAIDSEIAASVEVTFFYEDNPATVYGESSALDGIYEVDQILPGAAKVEAHSKGAPDQSPVSSTTVVGEQVATVDLQVFPFDPDLANFIPIIEEPSSINFNEDTSHMVSIGDFSVIDLDDSFPTGYTLYVGKGQNYAPSDILQGSAQLTPSLDYNGAMAVPILISDGVNTSAPAVLLVTINPLDDPIVHVDFDNGKQANEGGTGGALNPLRTVGEALGVVTVDGAILIKGIAASTEPPLTINQSVTLQNNNAGPAVRIEPSISRDADTASPANSGFVTRSGPVR